MQAFGDSGLNDRYSLIGEGLHDLEVLLDGWMKIVSHGPPFGIVPINNFFD